MQTLDVFAVSPKEMQDLGINRATAQIFGREGARPHFTSRRARRPHAIGVDQQHLESFREFFPQNAGLSYSCVR
jgi:hypothetical protein